MLCAKIALHPCLFSGQTEKATYLSGLRDLPHQAFLIKAKMNKLAETESSILTTTVSLFTISNKNVYFNWSCYRNSSQVQSFENQKDIPLLFSRLNRLQRYRDLWHFWNTVLAQPSPSSYSHSLLWFLWCQQLLK